MNAKSQLRDPFARLGKRGAFSAWAMAIVFAAVAVLSFAIDQTVGLTPGGGDQSSLSLLHPVELFQSMMDAAAE